MLSCEDKATHVGHSALFLCKIEFIYESMAFIRFDLLIRIWSLSVQPSQASRYQSPQIQECAPYVHVSAGIPPYGNKTYRRMEPRWTLPS
jgi:hypothetical protein